MLYYLCSTSCRPAHCAGKFF